MTAYILETKTRGHYVRRSNINPAVHDWTHDKNEATQFDSMTEAVLFSVYAGIGLYCEVVSVHAHRKEVML